MAKIKKDTNLRKSILQAAITGQLISNVEGETKTGKELLDKIIEERNAKLLAQWEEAKKKNSKAKKPTPIVASEITEDEIPFEIPKNWCWCRLGDLVLFGECENAEPNEIEDDAWILDLEDIEKDSGRIIQFKKKKEIDSKSTKHIFKEGNVLYSKLRPYLNKCVIAPKDGYCTSEIIPLDFGKFISNKYAQKFLMSPYFVDYTVSLSYGVKMPRLGTTDGKKALIPLPPLAVQNAIVVKLEEVLPLVDAYENAVLQKEELKTALPDKVKKAILQEAIQGKLTKSWRKTTTIEESGKQLLDRIIEERNAKLLADWEEAKKKNPKAKKPTPIAVSEITEDEIPFEIPKSWCWCRLSNLCNLYTGNSINETEKKLKYTNIKDGWVYIGTKDVGFDQTINYDNGIKIPFEKDTFRIAPKNTVLMCIEGGSAGRKIAFTNQDVCFGNKLCCFNPYKYEVEKFLFYFLQSTVFIDAFKDNINGIIGGVSINKIKEMLFPLPPLAEQEKIVEIIEQILPLCEKLGG
ncbi:restriction endonuclease subunit S [Campylobacter devanensis]|uniref:restriction endonuclease subunit S n=1 Tax=Campylobacter devanensis TaxID=3161138 RepID=UPI0015C4F700|nr:restriction endonuclease subunit S [Campylobacter sp. P093]